MCNFLHWSWARRGTPSKVKTKRQKAGVIDEPKIVGDLGSLFMWSCTSPNKYLLSVLRPCHTTRQFVLATCNAIFAETKYCRLQLGCNLLCDLQWDYILCTPSILKCQWHSGYVVLWSVPSQKIVRKVAVGVSHAVTCHVPLRKVEAASTFSATCDKIFRHETSCKHGVSQEEVFLATCNATPLYCKLQGKLPCVTWPLDRVK